jgi:homoserine dehydrogenase
VEVRVHPTLIPSRNRLASIRGVTNAIMVRGHVVGDIEFSGPGAGGDATASAVLGDLAEAARFCATAYSSQRPRLVPCINAEGPLVAPMDAVVSRYYLRLSVVDRPGVMALISSVLGQARIGISSIIQPEGHEGKSVPLIFMIHDARNDAMQKAIGRIARLACVKARPVMLRVETSES